ncbi:MAG: ZIP family metal transporter, partial [Proteobacteria bacterium]
MLNSLLLGTLGGLISGLSTTAGAVPTLFRKNKGSNNLWKYVSLDFTLGMMLAASAFSLILPAFRGVPGNA